MIAATCAVALLASGMLAAQGSGETSSAKKGDAPVTITMWYQSTQTEVGPLPNDWVGYQILKDKFNIQLDAQSLPSNVQDQSVNVFLQ